MAYSSKPFSTGHDFTSAAVFKAIISSSKVNIQKQEPKLSKSSWNNTEREGALNNFYHHRRVKTCYINSISLTFHVISGNFYFNKWPSSILPKPVCLDLSSLIKVSQLKSVCAGLSSLMKVSQFKPVCPGLSSLIESGLFPFLPKPVCPEKPVLTHHHAERAPFWINVAQLSRLEY